TKVGGALSPMPSDPRHTRVREHHRDRHEQGHERDGPHRGRPPLRALGPSDAPGPPRAPPRGRTRAPGLSATPSRPHRVTVAAGTDPGSTGGVAATALPARLSHRASPPFSASAPGSVAAVEVEWTVTAGRDGCQPGRTSAETVTLVVSGPRSTVTRAPSGAR